MKGFDKSTKMESSANHLSYVVFRFYLIERRSGVCVGSYEAHSFFSFHHVNAYEDINGLVVVDLCCYPDATIIDQYYLHYLRNSKLDKVISGTFQIAYLKTLNIRCSIKVLQ